MLAPSPHITVRVAALHGLADIVRAAGVDFDALVRRQGIDPTMLNEPDNRLTFRQLVQLLDSSAQATGDDCLGLHLGAAQSIHIAGILGYAVQTSADAQSQLASAARYFALHQDASTLELTVEGDVVTLRYTILDPHVTLHRQDAEATLALCLNQSRFNTGQHWAPSSVHFEHPAPLPSSEREIRRFFGCSVYFSEPFDGMRFPTSFLGTPNRTADASLHQILTRYAEECLARHADSATITGRTRTLIAAGLSNGHASIEEVARRMAMTPRTLQRHLSDEGRQFSELLDDTRRDLAAQYLRGARITLTDAAFLVGYSDLTAFHRAFRRWFGQTPLEFQRHVRSPS